MAGSHSLLSPSGAHRWSRCPGSLAMCKGIPNVGSEDAARGTVQHFMGEQCLSRDFEPDRYLDETLSVCKDESGEEFTLLGKDKHALWAFKVNAKMVQNVQTYINGVKRAAGRQFYEKRIDTSNVLGVPEQGGTADALILHPVEKLIEVHDAKFGFIRVDAADNEQGIIYLAGAADDYELVSDWETAKFVIHQPGIDHYDEHTYAIADLKARVADIAEAGQLAVRLLDAPREEVLKHLKPGAEQCQWCPVRGSCEARANRVRDMFETLSGDAKEPGLLTDADIAGSCRRIDEIEKWCKDLRSEGLRRALLGHKLPAMKIIIGRRGPRKWKDKESAETALDMMLDVDQMYEPATLISPTEAERKLGDMYAPLAALVEQAPGSYSLVPEEEKGEAVVIKPVEFH